jgi:curved DNA-binding protein CbpA
MQHQDLYQILGVLPDASVNEIRTRYRSLVLEYHPDKLKLDIGTDIDERRKRFANLQIAYKVLSNATTRLAYDSSMSSTSDELIGASRDTNYYANDCDFMKCGDAEAKRIAFNKFMSEFSTHQGDGDGGHRDRTQGNYGQVNAMNNDEFMRLLNEREDERKADCERQPEVIGLNLQTDHDLNRFNQLFDHMKNNHGSQGGDKGTGELMPYSGFGSGSLAPVGASGLYAESQPHSDELDFNMYTTTTQLAKMMTQLDTGETVNQARYHDADNLVERMNRRMRDQLAQREELFHLPPDKYVIDKEHQSALCYANLEQ